MITGIVPFIIENVERWKMKTFKTVVSSGLVVSVALFLGTACTGLNEKQLAQDPVFTETQKMSRFVSGQRAAFEQLQAAYLTSHDSVHLARMGEIMELMRDELERADYFQKNNRYYRTGLDYERWKSAETTYTLSQKTLCEMMLVTGKLHMKYGNREYAADLFNAVAFGFEGENVSGYIEQANILLREGKNVDLYANSPTSSPRKTDDTTL